MSAMSVTSVILEIGEYTCRIGIEHDNFPRLQIPSYELGVCFSNWTDETNLQMIAKMSSLWFQKLCIKPRDFKVLVIEHILVNEKFRKALAIALLHVFGVSFLFSENYISLLFVLFSFTIFFWCFSSNQLVFSLVYCFQCCFVLHLALDLLSIWVITSLGVLWL